MSEDRLSFEEKRKMIPNDATRIYVKREGSDRRKWIQIEDLLDTDDIQMKTNGQVSVIRGSMGRPKKQDSEDKLPTYSPAKEEELERRTNYIKRDPLFNAVKSNPVSNEAFNIICSELAEISASMKFERALADSAADIDPAKKSTIINRHKESVKTLADTILKFRDQNKKASIDFEGEQFSVLFDQILSTFAECMEEAGVSSELIQTVIIIWQKKYEDGWLDEVRIKVDKV